MKISKDNYEPILLDYLEGCLSDKERKEVEAFLAGEPALRQEFMALQQAWGEQGEGLQLEPLPDAGFPDKAGLLAIPGKMKSAYSARNQSGTRAGVVASRNLQGQRETDALNSADRQVPMEELYERQDRKHAVWQRKNRANIWKVAVSMVACLLLFWLCLPLLQRDDIRDARLAERNPVLDTLLNAGQESPAQAPGSSRPSSVQSLLLGKNREVNGEMESALHGTQVPASVSPAIPAGQKDSGKANGETDRKKVGDHDFIINKKPQREAMGKSSAAGDSVKTQAIPAQPRPRRVDTLPEIKLTPAEYRRLVTPMAPPKAYYAANLMERESHEGQKGISQEETMDSKNEAKGGNGAYSSEIKQDDRIALNDEDVFGADKSFAVEFEQEDLIASNQADWANAMLPEEQAERLDKKRRLERFKQIERQQRKTKTKLFFASLWHSVTGPVKENWEETKAFYKELAEWSRLNVMDTMIEYQAFWEEESRF